MRIVVVVFAALLAAARAKDCPANKANSKLFCYFSKLTDIDGCRCSYVILPADADVKAVERARGLFQGVKILVTVNEFNQGLIDILKTSKVDGLEIDLKKLDSKSDINDFISTVRSKLGSDLYLALSVPARTETLVKYYDFKGLSKHADVFILQTAFLGASKNVTFHPSRLSGLWDTQNTDSMVDLVSGLGAPLSKVVISAPVQAFHFTLQNGEYSAPGSPALELKSITRSELCKAMRSNSNWTLERDQDQAGPYIFSGKDWIAFEDSSSIDVKAKYARVRGLAGLALKDVSQDGGGEDCGSSVLEAAYEGLSRQARAPRGAVLHSLERELQGTARGAFESVRVSPYRISRVIDVEGHVHVVRQDTRTEFTCSRQGFFAHPRSCNRFYRCVLFDQTSDEFSVFEFDCPAGLAFDERVEVCVWPGSLPEGRPCAGSSEIAPVPRSRFVCPHEPGYYADPENCRWFFACLDHGDSPLSAYEFRCPFGLVFDSERLLCEWPWLVPRCASLGLSLGQDYVFGGSGYASANALDQYNGLGSLGVVRLGGLSGQIHQPVIYSNIGGGGYPTATLGGLGIKATQSLHNAGLLRGTNVYDNDARYSSGAAQGSSLNQQSFGSAGAGTGSYSYNSNSGLEGSHNSASGGYISDTILGLEGTTSFGTRTTHNNEGSHSGIGTNLLNNNNEGSYNGVLGNTGSGNYIATTNLLNNNDKGTIYSGSSQYQGISDDGSNGYIARSNLGLDASSLLDTTNYLSNNNNEGSFNGVSNSASDSLNTQSKQQLFNNNNVGSYNGVPYSGSSQYHGSGGYIADSNLGLDASSLSNTITKQQLYNNNNEGSYNGATHSGSHLQYQNSIIGDSGNNIAGTNVGLDTSSLSGTSHLLLNNNNQDSSDGGASLYSNSFLGEAGATSYGGKTQYGLNTESAGSGYSYGNVHVGSGVQESGLRQQVSSSSNKDFGSFAFGEKDFSQLNFNRESLNGNQIQQGIDTPQYQYGSSGNIDIVGGGYSAVRTSNVQVDHNGENNLGLVHTTAAPVSISTYSSVPTVSSSPVSISTYSSVPTVTAVPVPTLSTPTAFEHYSGGVIANIPQLQYQIGNAGIANISSDFVSSTPYSYSLVNDRHRQYGSSSNGASSYNYQSQITHGSAGSLEVQGSSSNLKPEVDVSQSGGYIYDKPSIAFEETPVVNRVPIISHTYKPSSTIRPIDYVQSGVDVSQSGGYIYNKPSIAFEETPVVNRVPIISHTYTPSTTVRPVQYVQQKFDVAKSEGYIYDKPSIAFEEIPKVNRVPIVTHTYTPSTTVRPVEYVQPNFDVSQSEGYIYDKPSIAFQEIPKVNRVPIISHTYTPSTTVRPTEYVQPEVSIHSGISNSHSNFNGEHVNSGFQGYKYEKPSVVFEENSTPRVPIFPVQPQVLVSSTVAPVQLTYSQTIGTEGYQYPKSSIAFVERPSKPAIISRFSIKKPIVQETFVGGGYHYERPSVAFEQRPVQPVVLNYQQPIQKTRYTFKEMIQPVQPVSTYLPVTERTVVSSALPVTERQITVQPSVRPAVISSYFHKKPAVTRYEFKDVITQTTPRPIQQIYRYSTSPQSVVIQSTIKPNINYLPATERPIVINEPIRFESPVSTYLPIPEKPAAVSSYNYVYNNPTPTSYVPQIVSTVPVTQVPLHRQNTVEFDGYNYPKPKVSFVEEPVPSVVTHEIRQPVEEVPFVKKTSYITGDIKAVNPVVIENYQAGNYEKVKSKLFGQSVDESYNTYGTVSSTVAPVQQVYIHSTPKPTYVSTLASVVAAKSQSGAQESDFHYYDSRYSSEPRTVTEGYLYPKPTIVFEEKATVPTREYLPVTTSRPIVRYSFGSLDGENQYASQANVNSFESSTALPKEYLPVRSRVRVTTPAPTYSTESSTLARDYLPVRYRVVVSTPEPTYVVPTVTIPSRAHLPGRSRVRLTTVVPNREYLPVDSRVRVTTDGAASGNLEVSSRRPVKVIKVVKPRQRTIIKQNDMHPILSAKLGAQCTCVSNAINLRKKQRIIVVEDEEDDGYVVDNDDQSGTVIENYQYEPQRVVDITPTPEIYVQSTTNEIGVPSPAYAVNKRGRVRPSTTVAYDAEEEDESPSDKEVAKAVRTGLKLVKQAAKEGAKEGAEEAIGNYSPRTGSSREGIECQRAGLFRHPNQCNKFYSCKWDCKKNKFTLHVFNCPVHLTFDNNLGACNWPSQGPACTDDTLLPNE